MSTKKCILKQLNKHNQKNQTKTSLKIYENMTCFQRKRNLPKFHKKHHTDIFYNLKTMTNNLNTNVLIWKFRNKEWNKKLYRMARI